MDYKNTTERVLTKKTDNQTDGEAGPSKQNLNQKGKQMAKIIESEDIIVKQDCGFKQSLI